MRLKLLDWELYFRGNTSWWSDEEKPHSWTVSIELIHLSEREKKHRAEWEEQHPGEKYPRY